MTAESVYPINIDRRAGARKRLARAARRMPLLSSVHGGQEPLPTGGEKQEVARNEENSMGGDFWRRWRWRCA